MFPFRLQYLTIYLSILLWTSNISFHVHARRAVYSHAPVYDVESSELPIPTRKAAARHARKLVGQNTWATLSTTSVEFHGIPFGNVVAYSDGVGTSLKNSTGILYFYLMSWGSIGVDLAANSKASVSISHEQNGPDVCKRDVENPTCWKVTLIGEVKVIKDQKQDIIAKEALFSKHPEMAHWPKRHDFQTYMLHLQHIVILDFYGPAKILTPKEYFAIKFEE